MIGLYLWLTLFGERLLLLERYSGFTITVGVCWGSSIDLRPAGSHQTESARSIETRHPFTLIKPRHAGGILNTLPLLQSKRGGVISTDLKHYTQLDNRYVFTCPGCSHGVWYSALWHSSLTRWYFGRVFCSTSLPSASLCRGFLHQERDHIRSPPKNSIRYGPIPNTDVSDVRPPSGATLMEPRLINFWG